MSTSSFPSHPRIPPSHPLDELYDLVQHQALVPLTDVLALGKYYRAFLLLYFRLRKQGLVSGREASRLFLLGFHQEFRGCLQRDLNVTDPYDIPFSVELILEIAVDLFERRISIPPLLSPINSAAMSNNASPPEDLISFDEVAVAPSSTLPSSVSILPSSPQDVYCEHIPHLPFTPLVPTTTSLLLSTPPSLDELLAPTTSSAHSEPRSRVAHIPSGYISPSTTPPPSPLIVNATADSISSHEMNSSIPIAAPPSSSSPLSPVQDVDNESLAIMLDKSSCCSPTPNTDDHITNSLPLESVIPTCSQPLSRSAIAASPNLTPAPISLDYRSDSNTLHPAPGSYHQASSNSIKVSPPRLSSSPSISEDQQVVIQSLPVRALLKNYEETSLSCISSPVCPHMKQEASCTPPMEFEGSPIPLTTHPPGLSFHELPLPCIPNCHLTLSVLILNLSLAHHIIFAQLLPRVTFHHRARLKLMGCLSILCHRGFSLSSRFLSSHTGPPSCSHYIGFSSPIAHLFLSSSYRRIYQLTRILIVFAFAFYLAHLGCTRAPLGKQISSTSSPDLIKDDRTALLFTSTVSGFGHAYHHLSPIILDVLDLLQQLWHCALPLVIYRIAVTYSCIPSLPSPLSGSPALVFSKLLMSIFILIAPMSHLFLFFSSMFNSYRLVDWGQSTL